MGTEKITAVILAAGYATRLYPLTLNIPKPLLKVSADKTVIDCIVDNLKASGIVARVVVVTNSKFYQDFKAWARRKKSQIAVTVVDDGTSSNSDRLGAVGDIDYVVRSKKITGDFVVVGGDNLFDRGIEKFLKFALKHKPFPSLGLFDIKDKKSATRFGVVSVNREDRVTHFEEKPAKPRSTTVATCLYYFPAQTHKYLKAYVSDPLTSKDAPGNYIRWLMEKSGVFGFTLEKGHWYDIGHFDSYKEVVKQFTNKYTN